MSDRNTGIIRLEELPLEVLRRVCEHVGDVPAFALASKSCYSAAKAVLFSTVRIRFTTPQDLKDIVDRWRVRLAAESSFQDTRYLDVLPPKPEALVQGRYPDFGGEDLVQRWQFLWDREQVVPGEEQDQGWQPVADFIRMLPGLVGVRYTSWPQVAPCVLEAIEEVGCKLLHHSFALRSVFHPPDRVTGISPYEVRLATSASLTSVISTKFEGIDYLGHVNFMEQAAMSMASGLAPHLESVSLCYSLGEYSLAASQARQMSRPKWQGNELGLKKGTGSLRCLELSGKQICTVEKLRLWANATDFAKLTMLKIRDGVDTKVLRWLVTEAKLTSLHTLMLDLTSFRQELWDLGVEDFTDEKAELKRLFLHLANKLPPLHTFRVTGDCDDQTLGQFLQCQAATLQDLATFLYAGERTDSHSALREHWGCDAVRDLAIGMRRTGGDAEEVRFFRWIGRKFPDLRRLHLSVNCSEPGPELDEQSPEFDGSHVYHHSDGKVYDLRYAMKNFAVDADLLKSILHTIQSAKSPGSPRLEQVTFMFNSTTPDYYPKDCLKLCVAALGRNMVAQLDLSSHDATAVRVIEHSRLTCYDVDLTSPSIDTQAIKTFHSIWPEQPGKDWRESWHSFPLDLSTDEA